MNNSNHTDGRKCQDCYFYVSCKATGDLPKSGEGVCDLYEAEQEMNGSKKVQEAKKVREQPKVSLLEYPTENDWYEAKRRALVTVGKMVFAPPDEAWRGKILEARHSPIRRLRFSFLIENVPYWVSVHLCRHVHAQPYVKSQRNDRQSEYDRNAARQDEPVTMIWDMNAEELMVIANKRLCRQASDETRAVVALMCDEVKAYCPVFAKCLVPMCQYHGGLCHEMNSCWQVLEVPTDERS